MALIDDPLFKLSVGEFQELLSNHYSTTTEKLVNQKMQHFEPQQKVSDTTLDIDEATHLLKVSKQTIYQNIKSIPHRKIFGRLVFLRDELLQFIDQNGNYKAKNKGAPKL